MSLTCDHVPGSPCFPVLQELGRDLGMRLLHRWCVTLLYTNRFTLSLGSIQASYEGNIDAIDTAFPHKHVKET